MKIDKLKLQIAMGNEQLSGKKLSERSGVSEVTIARLKKGVQEARPETAGKIAKALNVPVTEIIES